MKQSKHKLIKFTSALVILAITFTNQLNALQGPGGSPPGGQTNTIDALPLDGGLIALVLGAVAFGVKKLYDKKNDKA